MKSYGEELHQILSDCLQNNPRGLAYSKCSQVLLEKRKGLTVWVTDYAEKDGCKALNKKTLHAFKIEAPNGFCVWLVCVDGCLIKDAKGRNSPKCDNLVFSEQIFHFVEAKMRVRSKHEGILEEIYDAIDNKIKQTKEFLFNCISQVDEQFSLKDIRIFIAFPGFNYSVPRSNVQLLENLRKRAEKSLKIPIKKFILGDTIVFTKSNQNAAA